MRNTFCNFGSNVVLFAHAFISIEDDHCMCIMAVQLKNTCIQLFIAMGTKLTCITFGVGLLNLAVAVIDNYVVPLDLI